MSHVEQHVKIGQLYMGSHGLILKALLGSCVGIGILWKEKGLYALAHCLLPVAPANSPNMKGKFVDQAVPNLLQKIGAETESDIKEIRAVVAGGSQMMVDEKIYSSSLGRVGEENLKAAKKYLCQYKIKTIAFEPGGDQGSQISIDCSTGEYKITKIEKFI